MGPFLEGRGIEAVPRFIYSEIRIVEYSIYFALLIRVCVLAAAAALNHPVNQTRGESRIGTLNNPRALQRISRIRSLREWLSGHSVTNRACRAFHQDCFPLP